MLRLTPSQVHAAGESAKQVLSEDAVGGHIVPILDGEPEATEKGLRQPFINVLVYRQKPTDPWEVFEPAGASETTPSETDSWWIKAIEAQGLLIDNPATENMILQAPLGKVLDSAGSVRELTNPPGVAPRG